MRMVGIGHMRMCMPQYFVRMPMAVLARRHLIVHVVVVAVVVPVRMFVLHRLVFMLVGV